MRAPLCARLACATIQLAGEADIIFAKHRNGPIGKVTLSFMPKYPRFASLYRDHGAVPVIPDGNGAG